MRCSTCNLSQIFGVLQDCVKPSSGREGLKTSTELLDISCRGTSTDSATKKTASALVSGMMGGTFARLAWFFKPLVAVSIFERIAQKNHALPLQLPEHALNKGHAHSAWIFWMCAGRINSLVLVVQYFFPRQMTGPFIAFHILE